MNLTVDEIAVMILSLEHYVECELDGDIDVLFPDKLPEETFAKAYDKLSTSISNDSELTVYFGRLYKKLKEAAE